MKHFAIWAATGSAAFLVGFAAVGLAAMTVEAITRVLAETKRVEQAVKPVTIEQYTPILPEASPEPEVVDEWPSPSDQPQVWGGTYYVDESTRGPRAFEDIVSFVFEMYDYEKQLEDGTYGVPIPPKGRITVGKTNFKLIRIGVGKDSIGFQTEERNGVSYRFTGKFNNFDYCETEEEQPDVVGRMIKLVNNKWAAEAEMSFFSEGCGC